MNRVRNTDLGRAENLLDRYFSIMIRERDKEKPCIACGKYHTNYQAGHYRRRELLATRWDYRNVNGEGEGCNMGHKRKYGIKDMDVYRENLNNRWGAWTAEALYERSKPFKGHRFTLIEIKTLSDAARKGWRVYHQIYDEINT